MRLVRAPHSFFHVGNAGSTPGLWDQPAVSHFLEQFEKPVFSVETFVEAGLSIFTVFVWIS